MDSQRSIGNEPGKRITRSWYPGSRGRARRSTGASAAAPPSHGTSALGTEVGYWGRVDSRGDFEEGSGFLAPFESRLPWRWLLYAVRRLLPLTVAALVGAVTALAWQSFLLQPTRAPAAGPALPGPAAPPSPAAHATRATENAPAALPRPPAPAPAPAAVPADHGAQPAVATPSVPLLGRPPSASTRARFAGEKDDRRTTPASPRPVVEKANANRTVRARGSATPRGASPDPDAILRPSFL